MNYILNVMLILGICKLVIGDPFSAKVHASWEYAEVLNYYADND